MNLTCDSFLPTQQTDVSFTFLSNGDSCSNKTDKSPFLHGVGDIQGARIQAKATCGQATRYPAGSRAETEVATFKERPACQDHVRQVTGARAAFGPVWQAERGGGDRDSGVLGVSE